MTSPGTGRAGRRRPAGAAAVVLAGLLAAGCAAAPSRPQSPLTGCIRVSISTLQRHAALTSMPTACRGLSPARLSYAADAAAAAVARTGGLHGKTLMRARRRDLSPLLPHLAARTAPQPGQPAAAAGSVSGPPAGVAALAAWLVTAILGLWLMAGWLIPGGLRAGSRRWSRLRMNLWHLGLAAAGLVSWISYLLTGLAALAWLACVLVLPVAGVGMALLFLRLPGRRTRSVLAVAAHVVFAVAAMLLTLLAAIGSA